ncbi:type II toxin-antitoxin system HicA family toxin [Methanolobus sp. WCC5]
MTVIPILSAHKVIKALESAGFKVVSQKGSHIKMETP